MAKCEGVVEVEKYRPMIAKAAWQAWRRLPVHTRTWIGIDDLIEDGMRWAHVRMARRWNPDRSNFLTWIYNASRNFYYGKYIEPLVEAQKRNEHQTISIQAVEDFYRERGKAIDFERVFRLRPLDPNVDILKACYVVDAFVVLFSRSSPELQAAIVRWFLRPEHTKYNITGRRFIETSREFRRLANWQKLDINDCRHLITSQPCLEEVSRRVLNCSESFLTLDKKVKPWVGLS